MGLPPWSIGRGLNGGGGGATGLGAGLPVFGSTGGGRGGATGLGAGFCGSGRGGGGVSGGGTGLGPAGPSIGGNGGTTGLTGLCGGIGGCGVFSPAPILNYLFFWLRLHLLLRCLLLLLHLSSCYIAKLFLNSPGGIRISLF